MLPPNFKLLSCPDMNEMRSNQFEAGICHILGPSCAQKTLIYNRPMHFCSMVMVLHIEAMNFIRHFSRTCTWKLQYHH